VFDRIGAALAVLLPDFRAALPALLPDLKLGELDMTVAGRHMPLPLPKPKLAELEVRKQSGQGSAEVRKQNGKGSADPVKHAVDPRAAAAYARWRSWPLH